MSQPYIAAVAARLQPGEERLDLMGHRQQAAAPAYSEGFINSFLQTFQHAFTSAFSNASQQVALQLLAEDPGGYAQSSMMQLPVLMGQQGVGAFPSDVPFADGRLGSEPMAKRHREGAFVATDPQAAFEPPRQKQRIGPASERHFSMTAWAGVRQAGPAPAGWQLAPGLRPPPGVHHPQAHRPTVILEHPCTGTAHRSTSSSSHETGEQLEEHTVRIQEVTILPPKSVSPSASPPRRALPQRRRSSLSPEVGAKGGLTLSLQGGERMLRPSPQLPPPSRLHSAASTATGVHHGMDGLLQAMDLLHNEEQAAPEKSDSNGGTSEWDKRSQAEGEHPAQEGASPDLPSGNRSPVTPREVAAGGLMSAPFRDSGPGSPLHHSLQEVLRRAALASAQPTPQHSPLLKPQAQLPVQIHLHATTRSPIALRRTPPAAASRGTSPVRQQQQQGFGGYVVRHDNSRLGSWTEEEKAELIRMVHHMKPCGASDWEVIADRLGRWSRGGASAERMYRTLTDPGYQKATNKHGRRINPRKGIAMHVMAAYALRQLEGREGNLSQIADLINAHPEYSKELDWSPRPGTKTYPRWKDALVGCFKQGRYPHLIKTDRKVDGLNVYRLEDALAT